MKRFLKPALTPLAVAAALAVAPLAQATNGYFKIGYGAKNRGLAGTGMAFGQDSLASAINPATLAGIGNRSDVGLELFNPQREGTVDARGMQVPDLDGPGPATALSGQRANKNSGATLFAIPSWGISLDLGDGWTTGLAVVANGGLNTRYNSNLYTDAFAPVIGQTSTTGLPTPPAPSAGPSGFAGFLEVVGGVPSTAIDPQLFNAQGTGLYQNPNTNPSLGVNLAQLLITPTIAYQINENHAVGFSPVIGYQRFRAYGLGLFQAFSSDPKKTTNNGNDDAWGLGARVGYQGNFGMFSIGASYTSQIYMEEFDDYAGLFAEQGDFDIPSTYGVGIAFRPSSKITIAADVTRINYSDVAAINNDGPTANQFFDAFTGALVGNPALISNPLGTDDGYGFGWDDVMVYKIGVSYAYSGQWTFRGGYNYGESPYDDDQTLFNVLAPGIVEHHATAGFTYSPTTSSEITVTYMHAFRNSQDFDYRGSFSPASGADYTGFGFRTKNDMAQHAIEISYGVTF
jgi:long-chain fatty acid transport protein